MPPAVRVSDARIVAASGVVIALLVGLSAVLGPDVSDNDFTPSSFNAGPAGSKAAYLTLRELGYDVERSYEPLTSLMQSVETTVLVIPAVVYPSAQDKAAARAFVNAGGIVLAIGDAGAGLVDPKYKGDPRRALSAVDAKTYSALIPSPLTRNAARISMAPAVTAPALDSSAVALYGDNPNAPVVVETSIGRGRLVWWANATPLTNEYVATLDNFQALRNLLGAPGTRRVRWVEYYNGHQRSLWSFIAATPILWAGAQCALLGIAALMTFTRRHGPVRSRAVDPRTSPIEFVDMLGALYRRAGARSGAVAASLSRFRRTVAARCGVPVSRPDHELASAVASRLRRPSEPIAALLDAAGRAAADPAVDQRTALDLIQRLQTVTESLHALRNALPARGGSR